MFYYELIHIHQDKSGKCWHARRFRSPSAGSLSEPRLYCISAPRLRVSSPRPGTNLNPALVADAFTSAALGVAGGPVGRIEVVALAAACSPPALSDSSESNLKAACRRGLPGGARAVATLLGPLAQLDNVSRASRQ